MKTYSFLFMLLFSLIACDKNNNSAETLDPEDITASANMTTSLSGMQQSLDNLLAASDVNQRHHWDSTYHHHDSLFWHHHNDYHHNTYTHDDHDHQWVAYDPAVNHHHHYHHPYPGHPNDSLVSTPNNHHHDNNDHHHPGHDLNHHHLLDSLHQVHNVHHP